MMNRITLRRAVAPKTVLLTPLLLLTLGQCTAAEWEGTDDFSSGISETSWTVYPNNDGPVKVAGANDLGKVYVI